MALLIPEYETFHCILTTPPSAEHTSVAVPSPKVLTFRSPAAIETEREEKRICISFTLHIHIAVFHMSHLKSDEAID